MATRAQLHRFDALSPFNCHRLIILLERKGYFPFFLVPTDPPFLNFSTFVLSTFGKAALVVFFAINLKDIKIC